MSIDLSRAAKIVEDFDCKQSNLIAILQAIQAEYSYLSEEALVLVAEKLAPRLDEEKLQKWAIVLFIFGGVSIMFKSLVFHT